MADWILVFLAGLAVAVVSGPLGCFVVWRRMAYFGETLAHASLLGVGLGMILGVNLILGALASSIIMVLLLLFLKNRARLASDTALGVIAHSSLALGLVSLGVAAHAAEDHHEILFGSVQGISTNSVILLWVGGALVIGLLIYLWRDLIAITVHEDLAKAEGINIWRTEFLFMMAMAASVAMAMQVVGLLLVTALTIIPAAAARNLGRSPEATAIAAALLACVSVILGLGAWKIWGLDAGPAVVLSAALIFILTLAMSAARGRA